MKSPDESGSRILKRVSAEHLKLTETFYPFDLRQPLHYHPDASISLVMSGNYLESYGRKYHSRRVSTVVFHPPQESHAVYFENDVRILSVNFSPEKLKFICGQFPIFDNAISHRSARVDWFVKNIRREFGQPDAFSMMAIEGWILELLVEASRSAKSANEKKVPKWLGKAKEFVHDNFTEAFSIEEISEVAGVHPGHLSRVFREKFGLTIGEYTRRLRVEFASEQIASTEDSLSEIALRSGFADQSHLNKNFKLILGYTPAEYRKNFR